MACYRDSTNYMQYTPVTDDNKIAKILKGAATKYGYIRTKHINSNKG
jgi:hypothetical protein